MLGRHPDTKGALVEALMLRYLERMGDHAVFMSRGSWEVNVSCTRLGNTGADSVLDRV